MADFVRYKVWCDTEGGYVSEDFYRDGSDPAPTLCPNDDTHTLDTSRTVIFRKYSDVLPVDPGSGGVQTDQMQHPHGWLVQRRGFYVEVPANTQNHDGYYRILDKQGAAMQYRAISGGYVVGNCQTADKFDIDLVVKGSDVGGVDGTNDVLLFSFCETEYPKDNISASFFTPDRSMLLYTTAAEYNPALPAVPVYFRVRYTAKDASNANVVDLHCYLEGFQPPAA